MVVELVLIDVRRGQSEAFETAFREAERILANARGYISHELSRCVERPDRFALLIRWATLEDHTVGFRGSPDYQQWKALLHRFFDPFPAVEHFIPLGG